MFSFIVYKYMIIDRGRALCVPTYLYHRTCTVQAAESYFGIIIKPYSPKCDDFYSQFLYNGSSNKVVFSRNLKTLEMEK